MSFSTRFSALICSAAIALACLSGIAMNCVGARAGAVTADGIGWDSGTTVTATAPPGGIGWD